MDTTQLKHYNKHTNKSDKDANENFLVHVGVDNDNKKLLPEELYPIIISVELTKMYFDVLIYIYHGIHAYINSMNVLEDSPRAWYMCEVMYVT